MPSRSRPITKSDLAALRRQFRAEFRNTELRQRVNFRADLKNGLYDLREAIRTDYSKLQTSVDRYLKKTETKHQEQRVLKARVDRLVEVLVSKRLVDEKELALIR